MVDNGLGVTMLPEMAIKAHILDNTGINTRPLNADHPTRSIALVWRKASPRGKEFHLLAGVLREAEDR
jgi:LysR family hydrogen peroxide-inducible transcriptional activator